ncbi:bifunctional hydroxymethylpyrimidine kinase/phosphomethylpyrimidine kinase [Robbsia sp. Bb-Pol-6]|uniref:Bifunctional hydroxymethylpyrimidine kinase/phosphomethylpyrimidine kinase n=1 Tax=Robbsia betulipollinis TaxID=2981849 RepID=A0ABT3ZLW9_9BURK|nr:bifunctional hydroxymethylpyrimidine kinase/phosphomethylpyrimidine kinase [Robbsia betulipollinis]MCY0387534.1 bifunctional hydroxymethylpyrimidine kinase/phosphomethylpyrimidine kinase [Robbsia betulipollinis]
MTSDAPPIVLTFGISDPTGASGIQADLLTLASMGCHGVTVLTGYAARDSLDSGELISVDPERVASQARMLLEDMPVAAFKIGATTRAEIVSAIAEVVADYDDVPLIVCPDFTLDDEHVLAGDDLREAIAELLAPQTSVMVADRSMVLQLMQSDSEGDAPTLEQAVAQLVEDGCEYLLLSEHTAGRYINTLFGEEGEIRQDVFLRDPQPMLGIGDTLASAIAALLATGMTPPDAVREAQNYLYQAVRAAFRPGMGAYIPQRMFWAHRHAGADAPPMAGIIADPGGTALPSVRH